MTRWETGCSLDDILAFAKEFEAIIPDSNDAPLSRRELILVTYIYTQQKIKSSISQINYFHHSNVQIGQVMDTSDRSVHAGRDISGSIIQTGDHNTASLETVQLPGSGSVDIQAVLSELRQVLVAVSTPDAAKIGRALDDAQEELSKPEPDKSEVAGVLTRALAYAKKAADFSEHFEKIKPLVVDIAGWVGAAAAYAPLLATIGLCAA